MAFKAVMTLYTGTYEMSNNLGLIQDHPLLALAIEYDSTIPGLRALQKNSYLDI